MMAGLVAWLLLGGPAVAREQEGACGLGRGGEEWPKEQGVQVVGPGWYREGDHTSPLYLPLVLVVDRRLAQRWGQVQTAEQKCQEVAEEVAAIFTSLGVRVVLVGVEVWWSGDRVRLVTTADTTLARFLTYRSRQVAR